MTMLAESSAIVAELVSGGEAPEINMMIGVGVVKDSEAVLFHYVGKEELPQALMHPRTGNPLTRLSNVKLVGLDIAKNIGTENATKLNVILELGNGNKVLVTSGIQTWWSQCVMAGLFGLFQNGLLTESFNLDSYRGKMGRKPIFASIRCADVYSDKELYAMLMADRKSKAWESYEQTVTTIISDLSKVLNAAPVQQDEVKEVLVEVAPVVAGDF
jgi:hypothetical protein